MGTIFDPEVEQKYEDDLIRKINNGEIKVVWWSNQVERIEHGHYKEHCICDKAKIDMKNAKDFGWCERESTIKVILTNKHHMQMLVGNEDGVCYCKLHFDEYFKKKRKLGTFVFR